MKVHMTDPPSPITIAGEAFTDWRYSGPAQFRRSMVEVTTDREWGMTFLGHLGGYIPGLTEDGTAVEWYVNTVTQSGVNQYKALLIPDVRAGEKYL